MDAARYAIYFIPSAESGLYRFGRSVLGYDCYTGEEAPFPADPGAETVDWETLTVEPRRYGFHATLKAPFYLASSCSEVQLVSSVANFAKLGHQIVRTEPDIRALGNFIALEPHEPSAALNALANQCTTIFDAFRAPMTAQERARRVASRLSASQLQNLDRWGYPYVFDDFRFHMTLTGPVPAAARDEAVATLRRLFATLSEEREIAVDRLALVKQAHGQARFRVICQAGLN